ncbi:LTA synthase family protein [Flavihumibacter profundi]|uniref:LTA synthase family protein n=1 Tax=Flavihumibacter profundi TaxID=2716883 RepID=UPI001CC3AAF9|nr:LTA synthase family protein [Flavihumibacter profundi]MBZ5856541.1 LTA synthase family protein [Flavihumibacter profundi]
MNKVPRPVRWTLTIFGILLLAMTAARIFAWYVFRIPVVESGGIGPTFWLGLRYDARVAAAIGLFILLLCSFPVLNPFRNPRAIRGWNWFFVIICLTLTLFYVVDFLHFRYLNQRLNASALTYLEDTSISAGMVWQTYPVLRIFLVVIIATWLFYRFVKSLFRSIANGTLVKARWMGISSSIICGLFFAVCIFGRVGQYPLRWSDAFNLGNDFKANIALNPVQSFFSSFSFRSSSYDAAKLKQVYPAMAAYLGVEHPDSTKFTFERQVQPDTIANWQGQGKPNIILVICESFSGYKSSMWGSPLNTTPYFAELCKNGLFFDNCFSPLIGTAKGVWATLTGIPDVELVKTASRNPMMVDQHTIINNFDQHKKYYFLGGSTSWANIRGILTNNIHGLNIYEEGSYDVPKVDVWGISDKNLFLEADKVLQKEDKPFFAVIQTADNHRPYTIPEEDRAGVGLINFPTDSLHKYGFESNDELNAFRYTDYCFKQFMEAARKSPYFENTIFVFVGDHGIAGNAGPLFPKSWTENHLSAHHIPLLFYAPGKIKAARLHDLASQVDVLPTIAGIANIPYRNTSLGRDLLVSHQLDNGLHNKAFILDYNNKSLGVIQEPYYYTKKMEGKASAMVWADFNRRPEGTIPATTDYEWWSQAYFQTARYMLLHNKK